MGEERRAKEMEREKRTGRNGLSEERREEEVRGKEMRGEKRKEKKNIGT